MEVEVEGILKLEWIMESVRIWDVASITFLMDEIRQLREASEI